MDRIKKGNFVIVVDDTKMNNPSDLVLGKAYKVFNIFNCGSYDYITVKTESGRKKSFGHIRFQKQEEVMEFKDLQPFDLVRLGDGRLAIMIEGTNGKLKPYMKDSNGALSYNSKPYTKDGRYPKVRFGTNKFDGYDKNNQITHYARPKFGTAKRINLVLGLHSGHVSLDMKPFTDKVEVIIDGKRLYLSRDSVEELKKLGSS